MGRIPNPSRANFVFVQVFLSARTAGSMRIFFFGYDTIRVHLRYISQIFRTRKRSRWVGVHKNHYFALMVSAMLALLLAFLPCRWVLMRCVKTEHMMLIPVPCPACLVAFPFLSAGLGESRPTNLCPTTVRYIITELAHVHGTTLSRVLS
jgi:hypothetical protein